MLAKLQDRIAAQYPGAVAGLSGTNPTRVDYNDGASEADRAAIKALVDGWDFNAPAVPVSVTLAQARAAIRRMGLFDTVQAAVTAAGGEALDAWEYSNQVSRNSTLVTTLAATMKLTDPQLDELFRLADTIVF
jgi:hypothetical protein